MAATIPEALGDLKGLLYVRDHDTGGAYKRMGSVRGLLSRITAEKTNIKADDNGTVLALAKPPMQIECTFLEVFDVSLMDIILCGTRTNVAGTPVAVTGEALGTGWTVGQPIKLANKNGANTQVASITVYEGASPLVDGTNYDTYVATSADANGDVGYTYIVPLTAATGAITADYTYTPNESASFNIVKESQQLPTLDVKIESETDSDGKQHTIIATDCTLSGDYVLELVDVAEAGDLSGSPIVFDVNDGGNLDISTTRYTA